MPLGVRRAYALALTLMLALTAPSALAVEGRYTTLFDEFIDDKKEPTSSAEISLVKSLMAAGVNFIDEAQSRKIRSVTDAGQLLGGSISPVITSLDADVIIAGICRLDVLKSDLLGPNAHRYDATIEAKAISVATGQVLAVFQTRGQAMAFVARQAAQKAAQIAASALSKELLEVAKRPKAAPNIDLTIQGISDLRSGERARKAIEALSGVAKVSVAQASRGTTKFILEVIRPRGAGARARHRRDAGPGCGRHGLQRSRHQGRVQA